MEISCLCLVHGKGFLVLDSGSAHCGDVAFDPFGALDDPASGALYVVQEERRIRVYVFLFQDEVCFLDLECFDVLYDGLGRFFCGNEMGRYSCVLRADLLAFWLVLCALESERTVKRGQRCVEGWPYLSVLSLCWRAVSSWATCSLSSMMEEDWSRRLVTNGVHCSANLTKLMNAERIKRVRSGSGRWMSFALKSMMRAAFAKRVR